MSQQQSLVCTHLKHAVCMPPHCWRKDLEIEQRLFRTTDGTLTSLEWEVIQWHTWSATIVWRRVATHPLPWHSMCTNSNVSSYAHWYRPAGSTYDKILSFTRGKTSHTMRVHLCNSLSAKACESLSPAPSSDTELKYVLLFMQVDLESSE